MDSCRLARVADADAIARCQIAAWQERYRQSWPAELLASLDPDGVSHEWARAILSPPVPQVRVLVATDATDTVAGFAALGPTNDPDLGSGCLEVVAWEVHPESRGSGHGSRLMSAVADTARSLGAESMSMWLATDEDARRKFATACGWGPDTAHRVRESAQGPDAQRAEIRLMTWLDDTDSGNDPQITLGAGTR